MLFMICLSIILLWPMEFVDCFCEVYIFVCCMFSVSLFNLLLNISFAGQSNSVYISCLPIARVIHIVIGI